MNAGRWTRRSGGLHFDAGLYVAPFLTLLAVTGLVMLAHEPIDRWQLGVSDHEYAWRHGISPGTRRDWTLLEGHSPTPPSRAQHQLGRDRGDTTQCCRDGLMIVPTPSSLMQRRVKGNVGLWTTGSVSAGRPTCSSMDAVDGDLWLLIA